MLIAVPNCQSRVSPVFDVAARLVVVRLKGEAELERREVVLFENQPEGMVRSLRELGVELLICGGISQWLEVALERVGIRVLAQICGEVETVVAAYRTGRLNSPEFIMPGCCGRRWGAPDGTSRYKRSRSSHPVRGVNLCEQITGKLMKIAIPVENGRLNSHFGGSSHFAIIEVDTGAKATLASETVPAPEHQPGAFPRWLRGLGVQVVIAGGIGQRALAMFAQSDIKVVTGQPDAPIEVLVAAYLAGHLVQTPEGCAHHHGHHGDDHEHGHGQHGHAGAAP